MDFSIRSLLVNLFHIGKKESESERDAKKLSREKGGMFPKIKQIELKKYIVKRNEIVILQTNFGPHFSL